MKNIIMILISIVFVAGLASAQTITQSFPSVDFRDNTVTEAEIELAETSFSEPGLLPDNPFYFLKRFSEDIRLLFTFDEEKKAALHLDFAKVRLSEAKALITKNKSNEAKHPLEEFNKEMNIISSSKALSIANDAEEVLEKSALVLSLVSDKVHDEARPSIENAINNSIENKVKMRFMAEKNEDNKKEIGKEIEEETERNREIGKDIRNKAEEAKEKIKGVEKELLALKSEINKTGAANTNIERIIQQAEKRLERADKALNENRFGEAFGQANSAEHLIENARKILEKNDDESGKNAEIEKEDKEKKSEIEESDSKNKVTEIKKTATEEKEDNQERNIKKESEESDDEPDED